MSNSDSSGFVRFINHTIVSILLVAGLTGCADVVTYSRDAQREGMTLYKQGDYANAAGAFRNSVRQNPRNYEGYYYLGASYEQMSQYQLAIASYKTARQTIGLTVEGKYDLETRAKILDGLATTIAKSDQRNIELDAVQKEAEGSQIAENWLLLAKIHSLRGDADSAIDAYNRASLIEPNNFLVCKDYGLFLEKVGQAQRAESPLRRAYALNREDEQINAALRRIGVVPGPSLLDEKQLAKPLVPKGPLPEMQVPRIGGSASNDTRGVAAPRD